MQKGGGYIGSSAIQTSVANQEIIPIPVGWTLGYYLYKFSLYNDQACTISINGGNPIYLRAGQGLSIDQGDKEITSLKFGESNITYTFIGAF